ncbi:Gfo/Idh/MocA family oxidoreductase [Actinoplanes sp. NPDC051633]|uniref:Gfo/Idh/MocA family protein n=1 Tax=Actinoplanes sp. NPDC051633 TaxID=3155670 RepID=UPI0034440AFD
MLEAVRWGVLGTGSIARTVVDAVGPGAFVAAASRSAFRAQAFGLPTAFDSYSALIESDTIDAVYIALPNALHAEWTARALAAGKHVLCEKPFAATAADATLAVAKADDLVCAEGFMWRLHPQTALARSLVADGAIGRLAHVRAALRITAGPGDVRLSAELGGGAMSDLGCYCLSAMRLFAGEPQSVQATGTFGEVDIRIAALLALPGGVTGAFDAALDMPRADELELVGDAGTLRIRDPWICRAGYVSLVRDGKEERLPVDPTGRHGLTGTEADPYRIEFARINAAITGASALEFGPEDAVAWATAFEQVLRAAGRSAGG